MFHVLHYLEKEVQGKLCGKGEVFGWDKAEGAGGQNFRPVTSKAQLVRGSQVNSATIEQTVFLLSVFVYFHFKGRTWRLGTVQFTQLYFYFSNPSLLCYITIQRSNKRQIVSILLGRTCISNCISTCIFLQRQILYAGVQTKSTTIQQAVFLVLLLQLRKANRIH